MGKTMTPSSSLRFILINNLSPNDVKNAKYVIYAHVCSYGRYVGLSNDPVKRWQEHYNDAHNQNSHHSKDEFKEAIRKCKNRFTHYILAIADFETAARRKEAAAIQFYDGNLNTRPELDGIHDSYHFSPIGKQLGQAITLKKKSSTQERFSRSDSDRQSVIGQICIEGNRKRLRVIKGQPFPEGMYISCAADERNRFNSGDRVRIKVAESKKANGTKYLTAAMTSKLVLEK